MKTVLIIDDEPELLELLRYFFKQLNYEVIAFPDVVPIELFEDILPDVVVLDNNLGTRSGGDLCLELKNTPATWHIPVVLLSSDERLKEIAKNSCADAFVAKPFDIGNFYQTIKSVSVLEV